MPRYYFHICNGDGFTVDEEGRELIDLAAAREAAIAGARDLMSTEIREYDTADAPHYLALGALAGLEKAGYAIEKAPVEA